jgi:SAM-dependent methyltransferase
MSAMSGRPLDFRKILVAGCGTGLEVFALARTFPKAKITGVDFSARSIREALARRKRWGGETGRRITFFHADLTDRNLKDQIGDSFDYTHCHGVLSCIPRTGAVLRNFSRCLSSDGILYIGTNGSAHYSERWRPALHDLGVDLQQYRLTGDLRRFLQIFDAVEGNEELLISRMGADYLSSDLITGFILNQPLSGWIDKCRSMGLHFAAELNAFRDARKPAAARLLDVLSPRSRAEVHQLIALIKPAGFNCMLFTKRSVPTPPSTPRELLRKMVVRTGLYRFKKNIRRSQLCLTSSAINTRVDLTSAQWVTPFLEKANGKHATCELLQMTRIRPGPAELQSVVYMLYQLGVVSFC